jgi:ribonucleoside-diphosphate reductase alpha chain
VKPAGNSGELYGTASGIHPRYAHYYVRNIRVSRADPVAPFLIDSGVPYEVSKQNARDFVFQFPRKSPDDTVLAKDVSCLDQLKHWLHVKKNYTTHTVSATIYVREHEWDEAADWVYEHYDEIPGLAFLPCDGNVYEQAPFQPITKEEYEERRAVFPHVLQWDDLKNYEQTDTTSPSQELVCTADRCMI